MRAYFKRIISCIFLVVFILVPVAADASTPVETTILRSYIKTNGDLRNTYNSGKNDTYKTRVSYQKQNNRFLFQCTYSNGNSTSTIRMYIPVSKQKSSFTVYFDETVRASKLKAIISGTAILKRKTYNNRTTSLKFSRKNKTAVSKRITNTAYQNAANSILRIAFSLWERELRVKPSLCFMDFGFKNIV